MSHRALILSAMTVGETAITGLLEGEDVINTGKAMRALGASVERLWPGNWRGNGGGGAGLGARLSDHSDLRGRCLPALAADEARARSVGADGRPRVKCRGWWPAAAHV